MAVLATPREELEPDPRAWGEGSGRREGKQGQGSRRSGHVGVGVGGTDTALPRVTASAQHSGCGAWNQAPRHHSEVTVSLSHPVPVLPSQTLPSKPPERVTFLWLHCYSQSPRPGCTWLDLPDELDTPDTLDAAMPVTITPADTQ